MNARFPKRLLVVWLALCAATIVSLVVGSLDGPGPHRADAVVTSSAIVIALLKVRFIFREFMDVRHAPVLLSRLTDAWVLVTGVSLLGAYFAGTTFSME